MSRRTQSEKICSDGFSTFADFARPRKAATCFAGRFECVAPTVYVIPIVPGKGFYPCGKFKFKQEAGRGFS
jgi:hypothetical protein